MADNIVKPLRWAKDGEFMVAAAGHVAYVVRRSLTNSDRWTYYHTMEHPDHGRTYPTMGAAKQAAFDNHKGITLALISV